MADDRGVVAVLDRRLAAAPYAPVLLATLPRFCRARSREAVLASLQAIDAAAPPVRPVGPPPAQHRSRRAGAASPARGHRWSSRDSGARSGMISR